MKLLSTILLTAGLCCAQSQLVDILYTLDSTRFTGDLKISWPPFTTAAGQAIAAGTKTVRITNGVINIPLWPTQGAGPATSYTVSTIINNQLLATERWGVPVSSSPVTLASVRNVVYSGNVGSGGVLTIGDLQRVLGSLADGCLRITSGVLSSVTCGTGSGGSPWSALGNWSTLGAWSTL